MYSNIHLINLAIPLIQYLQLTEILPAKSNHRFLRIHFTSPLVLNNLLIHDRSADSTNPGLPSLMQKSIEKAPNESLDGHHKQTTLLPDSKIKTSLFRSNNPVHNEHEKFPRFLQILRTHAHNPHRQATTTQTPERSPPHGGPIKWVRPNWATPSAQQNKRTVTWLWRCLCRTVT